MQVIIDLPEVTLQEVRWHGLYLCPRDRQILEDAIKNAVSVVRCKDCEYFMPGEYPEPYGICLNKGGRWMPDGFCADGEPKEDSQ